MIALFVTLQILSVDVSHSPRVKVRFTTDSFFKPEITLTADSIDYGAPRGLSREGETWEAWFETDLRPGEHQLQITSQDATSDRLSVHTPPWPPGCPVAPETRWERLVSWWHGLFN